MKRTYILLYAALICASGIMSLSAQLSTDKIVIPDYSAYILTYQQRKGIRCKTGFGCIV